MEHRRIVEVHIRRKKLMCTPIFLKQSKFDGLALLIREASRAPGDFQLSGEFRHVSSMHAQRLTDHRCSDLSPHIFKMGEATAVFTLQPTVVGMSHSG